MVEQEAIRCLGVHVCSIGYLLSFISPRDQAAKISDISDFLILRRDTFLYAFIKFTHFIFQSLSSSFPLVIDVSRIYLY